MAEPVRILGIPGSLRAASYNRALLSAAQVVAPAGVEIELFALHEIPLYDGDVEAEGDPVAVKEFKDAIREADALLIATPEYNRGITGVLKNALDWASRPPFASPLVNKPVAVIGASPGMNGTRKAQEQVREALAFSKVMMLSEPEVAIAEAYEQFDDELRLHHEPTRDDLRELVAELARAADRARPALAAA